MNKLKTRIADLLRQGTSPNKICLTIILGLAFGTIPILGTTTLFCAAAAMMFRLNMPLIQLINYFVYPVQLLIYIPLMLLGASLLDSSLKSLTITTVYAMLRADMLGTIQRLFWANLGAVLIWGAITLPLGFILYAVVQRLMREFHKKIESFHESL
jgi:uncharacterized protein (DUF2062 family)